MIVFTATHKETGRVFVGSARDSMEVTWAQLLNQADDGASGDFFAIVRRTGATGFALEEWAYAESSRELRELMLEAQQELDAAPIKGGVTKVASGSVSCRSNGAADRVREELRELMALECGEPEEEPFSDWLAVRRDEKPSVITPPPREGQQASRSEHPMPGVEGVSKKRRAQVAVETLDASPKLANGHTGSTSKEKRIREAIAQQRQQREQLRQTRSTEEAAEMHSLMLGIEARRLAARKQTKVKNVSGSRSGKAGAAEPRATSPGHGSVTETRTKVKPASSDRTLVAPPANGRTGSASKEKRIKEGIAREKAEREAQRQSRVAAEANEMADILARLDARNKEAAKIKRRR